VKQRFHLVKAIGKGCKIKLPLHYNTTPMYRLLHILLLLQIMLLLPTPLQAQNGVSKKKETPVQLKKAVNNLEKSLIEDDNTTIARNYELLARELSDKDDFANAEEYLFKSLDLYSTAQFTAGRARVLRNIARVQELQNKFNAATKNYKAATLINTDPIAKSLNLNDYNRLKNKGNAQSQEKYLNLNLSLLRKQQRKAETADTYMQLAQLNLYNGDTVSALEQYRQALPYAENVYGKTIKIYGEAAELYVASEQYEDAIDALKKILSLAVKNKDHDTQIIRLEYLASVYFKADDPDNAVSALKESYKIASANGETFEARESVLQLVEYYKSIGDDQASMQLYEEFLRNIDRIILSDKSLTDAKTFKVTEERIRGLENEKLFKEELITRKNTFNYFLLGSMLLLLLLLAFIVKALYSIKTKNKEIALQSLRREMNPHFLFNSLNSVNQFIAQNNELEANKYLTSYSNLMRNTMENSNKDFVTLGNEIENLTKYLELEHLRFKDKFDFKITVDEKLDPETIWVPNMIIQPHLENAIWHGLRYKEGKGMLKMNVMLMDKRIVITIDDDGIGPARSSELKTHNQKAHQSRGLTNTKERMTLLNELYKTKMDFTVTEKAGPETGTIIEITFPIIHKP
jgi:two-component system sensor histidine kinase YesM